MANKCKIILALALAILVPLGATLLLGTVFSDMQLESEALGVLVGIVYVISVILWITYMMELVNKWNDRE